MSRKDNFRRWKFITVIDEDKEIHKDYELKENGGLKEPFQKKKPKKRWGDYHEILGLKVCFPYNPSPHQISNREKVPDKPTHMPCPPTQSEPALRPEKVRNVNELDDSRETLPIDGGPPPGEYIHEGSPTSKFDETSFYDDLFGLYRA